MDKEKITRNLIFLKRNLTLTCIYGTVDILVQNGIFDMNQSESIRLAGLTTEERCQKLIDQLLRSPASAYRLFLDSLKLSNPHIIEKLERTVGGKNYFMIRYFFSYKIKIQILNLNRYWKEQSHLLAHCCSYCKAILKIRTNIVENPHGLYIKAYADTIKFNVILLQKQEAMMPTEKR